MTNTGSRIAAHRRWADRTATMVVTACGLLSIAVLLGIFALLVARSVQAFGGGIEMAPLTEEEKTILGPETVIALEARHTSVPHPVEDVLLDPVWRPSARGQPRYGIIVLVLGTLLTTLGAMAIAVPIGIGAAAWLAFSASGPLRELVKLGVELLAAVPSVVIGFLGIQLVGPAIAYLFGAPGGLTALNGAALLALMALPTIVSISEDALTAVPRSIVEGALALGADRWQMLAGVVAPAAPLRSVRRCDARNGPSHRRDDDRAHGHRQRDRNAARVLGPGTNPHRHHCHRAR